MLGTKEPAPGRQEGISGMEGRRLEKKEEGGGKKLPWIITGAVAGTLAAAYLGLCAWAVSRDTILPNVSVAGVDVSNLTVEQARQAGCRVLTPEDAEYPQRLHNIDSLPHATPQKSQLSRQCRSPVCSRHIRALPSG